jgi:hypothetical protein
MSRRVCKPVLPALPKEENAAIGDQIPTPGGGRSLGSRAYLERSTAIRCPAVKTCCGRRSNKRIRWAEGSTPVARNIANQDFLSRVSTSPRCGSCSL